MTATVERLDCIVHEGRADSYQDAAAVRLAEVNRTPSHIAWVTPTCDTEDCLNPEHLAVHDPVTIAYPKYVCVYCGRSAHTADHLLPKAWSGEVRRRFVATVPACRTCNSVLGATLTWSITERRSICHQRLRRKYKSVLRTKQFTPAELDDFGPTLRSYIEIEMDKRQEVERMLGWSEDPMYDARAMQKSGIEDPWAIGLLHAQTAETGMDSCRPSPESEDA